MSVQNPQSTTQLVPEARFQNNLCDIMDIVNDITNILDGYYITYPISSAGIPMAKTVIKIPSQKDLIDNFILKTYTFWEDIRNKDKDFLIKNFNVLFGEIPIITQYTPQLLAFFNLLHSKSFFVKGKDEKTGKDVEISIKGEDLNVLIVKIDDKLDEIWDYLHACVKICIKYVFYGRDPEKIILEDGTIEYKLITNKNGKMGYNFKLQFHDYIKVKALIDTWEIKKL